MTNKFLLCFVACLSLILFVSCQKDKATPEEIFYGKWLHSQYDTIEFFKRYGISILKAKQVWSFIPGEREFEYKDEKLRLKDSINAVADFHTLNDFMWVEKGRSFQVSRADIYPVSADYPVTYVKIQAR